MARSIWKGSITFGLVNIPVGLYSAEKREETVSFHMLDRRNMEYSCSSCMMTLPIEAVKKWRFRPGTKGGKPVAVQAEIHVNFRLL